MAHFGRFYVPPFGAALNVVWATVKSYVPENSPCMDAIAKRRGDQAAAAAAGTAGVAPPSALSGADAERSRLHSASGKPDTNPFRTTCNAELSSYGGVGTAGDGDGDGGGSGGVGGGGGITKKTPQAFSMDDGSFDDDSSGGGGEFGRGRHKIDEWQAAWNVTNAIQGMFVVSLPFAVLRGGYWAIVAMVGIAYICCYTGKILVECLYELDLNTGQRVRVRDSYVSIARDCFGPVWGARAVNVAQMIELLMTCILYVVACGDLMEGTFPDGMIDTRSWMMITGVLLIPLGFLKHLHHVSLLSFWCTMSHILINIIILGYCVLELPDWGWSKVKWTIDVENFPISLGMIVFSYTSHIFLPTLEGNLIDRSKFDWMLEWSHISAGLFKSLFGYVCFLTFQNDTQQVITNNLHSPAFKGLVNVFLVVKVLLSYPLPYYAACDILEKSFFIGPPATSYPGIWHLDGELKVWGLAFRVTIIVCTVFMAISIPHFAILMGFIGSFTGTMLSFIWPCYFHLKLKSDSLEWRTIMFDCFVIFLGCLFGVIGVYDSGTAIIKAFQIGLPF